MDTFWEKSPLCADDTPQPMATVLEEDSQLQQAVDGGKCEGSFNTKFAPLISPASMKELVR